MTPTIGRLGLAQKRGKGIGRKHRTRFNPTPRYHKLFYGTRARARARDARRRRRSRRTIRASSRSPTRCGQSARRKPLNGASAQVRHRPLPSSSGGTSAGAAAAPAQPPPSVGTIAGRAARSGSEMPENSSGTQRWVARAVARKMARRRRSDSQLARAVAEQPPTSAPSQPTH